MSSVNLCLLRIPHMNLSCIAFRTGKSAKIIASDAARIISDEEELPTLNLLKSMSLFGCPAHSILFHTLSRLTYSHLTTFQQIKQMLI